MFAALITVCAWISIPVLDIAFTLQTLGIFLAFGLLGGKRGFLAVVLYLLLGAAGMPVFSGFQGGIGCLAGVTGGYLWGFAFSGLIYWLLERFGKIPAMSAADLLSFRQFLVLSVRTRRTLADNRPLCSAVSAAGRNQDCARLYLDPPSGSSHHIIPLPAA